MKQAAERRMMRGRWGCGRERRAQLQSSMSCVCAVFEWEVGWHAFKRSRRGRELLLWRVRVAVTRPPFTGATPPRPPPPPLVQV
jgi:hypothetical protein